VVAQGGKHRWPELGHRLKNGSILLPAASIPSRASTSVADTLVERFISSAVGAISQFDAEFKRVWRRAHFYVAPHRPYVNNLTAVRVTRTKLPSSREFIRRVSAGRARPPRLRLRPRIDVLAAGAGLLRRVRGFDNPSTAYLRWRAEASRASVCA